MESRVDGAALALDIAQSEIRNACPDENDIGDC
jgi:hypothetical protein